MQRCRQVLVNFSIRRSRFLWFATVLFFLFGANAGCTRLFFYPTRTVYDQLAHENPQREMIKLKSRDGVSLQGMRLLTDGKPQGVVLQLHGNAQNLTSHFQFVSWLPALGWEVLTFDYRGYGQSESSIGWFHGDLKGVLGDSISAIDWADQRAAELNVPLVIVGQSLGGALALRALIEHQPTHLKLILIDSSFYSFRSIATEKLTGGVSQNLTQSFFENLLMNPIQLLVSFLISDALSPGPLMTNFQSDLRNHPLNSPGIFIHSEFDPVVSKRQGDLVFESYPGPKEQWPLSEPGHIAGLKQLPVQEKLTARLRGLNEAATGP